MERANVEIREAAYTKCSGELAAAVFSFRPESTSAVARTEVVRERDLLLGATTGLEREREVLARRERLERNATMLTRS